MHQPTISQGNTAYPHLHLDFLARAPFSLFPVLYSHFPALLSLTPPTKSKITRNGKRRMIDSSTRIHLTPESNTNDTSLDVANPSPIISTEEAYQMSWSSTSSWSRAASTQYPEGNRISRKKKYELAMSSRQLSCCMFPLYLLLSPFCYSFILRLFDGL